MNCNLGKKLVRGEMAVGKVEREGIWVDGGRLLEFFFGIFPDQHGLIFLVMILAQKTKIC